MHGSLRATMTCMAVSGTTMTCMAVSGSTMRAHVVFDVVQYHNVSLLHTQHSTGWQYTTNTMAYKPCLWWNWEGR